MKSQYKLNGTLIKIPHEFKDSMYDITNSNRLADGTMSMELIAKKRKFFLTYQSINSKELQTILDILWKSSEMFYTFEFIEANVVTSIQVYKGEISKTLHRTSIEGGPWVYKDFTFNLIEK